SNDDEEAPTAVWEHEAGALYQMDDMKERLIDGQFITQKEIADVYGVSPTTAGNWVKKGVKLGRGTEDEVSAWFSKGKRGRMAGKTEAPVRPDSSWKHEEIQRTRRGLPIWVATRSRSHPLTLASLSPTKRRSGANSSGPSTSSWSEANPLSIFHKDRYATFE